MSSWACLCSRTRARSFVPPEATRACSPTGCASRSRTGSKSRPREPLLVVLEDLHWGDAPTVTYLGRVLKEGELPLMVLALARPEVHEAFPRLIGRAPSTGGLARGPRQEGGRAAHDARPYWSVAPDAGHGGAPRRARRWQCVLSGGADPLRRRGPWRLALPDTVVAMAHARPGAAGAEASAASFAPRASWGERFWVAAVAATSLGGEGDTESALASLEEARSGRPEPRRPVPRGARIRRFGMPSCGTRRTATLTKEDRGAAHRLLRPSGWSGPARARSSWTWRTTGSRAASRSEPFPASSAPPTPLTTAAAPSRRCAWPSADSFTPWVKNAAC